AANPAKTAWHSEIWRPRPTRRLRLAKISTMAMVWVAVTSWNPLRTAGRKAATATNNPRRPRGTLVDSPARTATRSSCTRAVANDFLPENTMRANSRMKGSEVGTPTRPWYEATALVVTLWAMPSPKPTAMVTGRLVRRHAVAA